MAKVNKKKKGIEIDGTLNDIKEVVTMLAATEILKFINEDIKQKNKKRKFTHFLSEKELNKIIKERGYKLQVD